MNIVYLHSMYFTYKIITAFFVIGTTNLVYQGYR